MAEAPAPGRVVASTPSLGASGAGAGHAAAAAGGAAAPAAEAAARTPATPGRAAATVHSAMTAVLHNEGLLLHVFSAFPDLADRLRLSLVCKAWLRLLLQDITLPELPSAARSLPALLRLAGGSLRTLDISRPCADGDAACILETTRRALSGPFLLEALPAASAAAAALTSLVIWGDGRSHRSLGPDSLFELAGRCPSLQRGSSRLVICIQETEDFPLLCSALSAIPGRHLVELDLDSGESVDKTSRLEPLRAALEQAAGHPNLAGVEAMCNDDDQTARFLLPVLRATPLTHFQLCVPPPARGESNAALFAALGECDSVETVSLSTDMSSSPPADLQALSSALGARAGALRHLRLSDVACRALLQPGTPLASLAEASLPHLQTLDLSHCGLNRLALSGLAAALVAAPQLRRADLSHNPLFPSVNSSFRAFASAISEHCPRLECLFLNATLLGGKCAVLLASALAARRAPVRELRVSGNKIGAAGAAALISAARLEELSATECGLQDRGVTAAAFTLAGNRTLRKLDLSMNCCEFGWGPKRIFTELARNTALRSLVWHNAQSPSFHFTRGIPGFDEADDDSDGEAEERDDGVQTVLPASEDPQEYWDEPVAEALSQMLKANSALQSLELLPGTVCPGFVEKLASGLALNTGLVTLQIEDCHDSDLEALGLALLMNTTLRQLYIGTVQNSDDGGSWTNAGAIHFAGLVAGQNMHLRELGFGFAHDFTRVGALALATIVLGSNEHLVLHLLGWLVVEDPDDWRSDEMCAAFSALPNGLRQRVIGDVGAFP